MGTKYRSPSSKKRSNLRSFTVNKVSNIQINKLKSKQSINNITDLFDSSSLKSDCRNISKQFSQLGVTKKSDKKIDDLSSQFRNIFYIKENKVDKVAKKLSSLKLTVHL